MEVEEHIATRNGFAVHETLKWARGLRLSAKDEHGREIARASLYIMDDDDAPEAPQSLGLLMGVYVEPSYRRQGIATELIKDIIALAKGPEGCYRLVTNDPNHMERAHIHALFEKLGFKNNGIEFRMDFRAS